MHYLVPKTFKTEQKFQIMPIESPCAQVAVGLFFTKYWEFRQQLNIIELQYCFANHLGQD